MAMADRCTCVDSGVAPIIAQAAKENPTLMKHLQQAGLGELALPPAPVAQLPEPPPTPKELAQAKVVRGYKSKFLGQVVMDPRMPKDTVALVQPLEGCPGCAGKGSRLFHGVMVTCECITDRLFVTKTLLEKVGQSGTFASAPQKA